MSRVFSDVPHDELQDFWRECTNAGISPSGFMVSATEESPAAGALKRKITVERTVLGPKVVREYDGSHGKDWIGSAVADIKSGVFQSAK